VNLRDHVEELSPSRGGGPEIQRRVAEFRVDRSNFFLFAVGQ
jgi:hypothetical protein